LKALLDWVAVVWCGLEDDFASGRGAIDTGTRKAGIAGGRVGIVKASQMGGAGGVTGNPGN